MKYLGRIAFLTTIWVLMWGSLSAANVLSGGVVAALLLVAFPVRETAGGPASMLRLRPVALARLLGWIGVQLVVSNAQLVREVVTRGSRIRTGIVACPLQSGSEAITTFVANVLALSPGTMPVDVQSDPPVVYVHVLHLYDIEATRRSVARLETLAVRSFGTLDELREIGQTSEAAS